MDKLDTMRLFLRVVESLSFSKAAKLEGLTQPTVSKQISALETRLGVQLLRRTSRGLSVTEVGRDYADACLRLLTDIDGAEMQVRRAGTAPSGRLRVAVSAGFGRMYIVPRLAEFLLRYPDITVDLEVSDRFANLIEDGIDVAIRIGELPDSALYASRIGTSRRVTIATPDYLRRHGRPATPEDLARHACVVFMFNGTPRPWRFTSPAGPVHFIPQGAFRTNDAEHVRAAVLAGLGICNNPSWLYADAMADGRVVPILTEQAGPGNPIHAVTAGRRPVGKIKAFVDFLEGIFAEEPHLRPQ